MSCQMVKPLDPRKIGDFRKFPSLPARMKVLSILLKYYKELDIGLFCSLVFSIKSEVFLKYFVNDFSVKLSKYSSAWTGWRIATVLEEIIYQVTGNAMINHSQLWKSSESFGVTYLLKGRSWHSIRRDSLMRNLNWLGSLTWVSKWESFQICPELKI